MNFIETTSSWFDLYEVSHPICNENQVQLIGVVVEVLGNYWASLPFHVDYN